MPGPVVAIPEDRLSYRVKTAWADMERAHDASPQETGSTRAELVSRIGFEFDELGVLLGEVGRMTDSAAEAVVPGGCKANGSIYDGVSRVINMMED